MKPHHHHVTIGADPWCDWTGCTAGQDITRKIGRHIGCGHTSAAAAARAAKALRPHFRRGRVKVVAGPCPRVADGA